MRPQEDFEQVGCGLQVATAGRLENHRALDCWTVEVVMPLSKRSVDPRSLRSPEDLSFVPFTRCTVMTCRARSRAPDASQSSLTMKTSPVAASRPPFPCSSMLPCSDREECRRLGCGMRVS
jgi:hypothetical protein